MLYHILSHRPIIQKKEKEKPQNHKLLWMYIFSSMMGESDDKRGFFKKLLTVPSTETDAIRLVSPLF
jgi:hypothetical protein